MTKAHSLAFETWVTPAAGFSATGIDKYGLSHIRNLCMTVSRTTCGVNEAVSSRRAPCAQVEYTVRTDNGLTIGSKVNGACGIADTRHRRYAAMRDSSERETGSFRSGSPISVRYADWARSACSAAAFAAST